jgi:hypothetical protein
METSKDIKGQGAIMAFFGINMSKNENPSKQNVILVVNLGLFFIYDKVGISK